MQEIKEGTLVIVFPNEDIPAHTCWGVVEVAYPSGHFLVQTEKTKTDRGIELPDQFVVKREYLIPIIVPEKTFSTPRMTALKSVDKILLRIFTEIFPKKNIPTQLTDLTQGTLVIVLDENPRGEPCWGVVKKIMPDGGMDITLGRKLIGLLRDKEFVKPERLIPILQAPGRFISIKRLVAKNIHKILMLALIQWLKDEKQN